MLKFSYLIVLTLYYTGEKYQDPIIISPINFSPMDCIPLQLIVIGMIFAVKLIHEEKIIKKFFCKNFSFILNNIT